MARPAGPRAASEASRVAPQVWSVEVWTSDPASNACSVALVVIAELAGEVLLFGEDDQPCRGLHAERNDEQRPALLLSPERGAQEHDNVPVYIGLRVNWNGPAVTSQDTAWCGTTVVPWHRTVSTRSWSSVTVRLVD